MNENMYDRIKRLRIERGYSQFELAKRCGYTSRSTISKIELGERNLTGDKIQAIANALGVKPSYLMDGETSLTSPTVTEDYVTFPVIVEYAAGFEKYATENIDGIAVDIPTSYLKGHSPDEFFVMQVKGSSMYPQYQNNDLVLVLKQSTMDYSGQIGCFLYDDEKYTLKKIEYKQGEDWIRLVPINPDVEPTIIENEDLERCRVIGIPKLVIREVKD